MTMRLKNTTTLNRMESKPVRSPTHVLSAATDAACELGIPPVSTSLRTLIFFSRTRNVNTLLSCTRKPHARAWKSGFDAGATAMVLPPPPLAGSPEQESGQGPEFGGAPPQPRGDPVRLAQEPGHLALGALDPDRRDGRGLAARLVRAHRLPDLLPAGSDVQEIVSDLERQPHPAAVLAEAASLRG